MAQSTAPSSASSPASRRRKLSSDVVDALAVPGPVLDELHAALGALLTRAQQAGAVRAEIGLANLVALLKALLTAVQDSDAGLRERVFAMLVDGLRPWPR